LAIRKIKYPNNPTKIVDKTNTEIAQARFLVLTALKWKTNVKKPAIRAKIS
jgi:hypothetical protein